MHKQIYKKENIKEYEDMSYNNTAILRPMNFVFVVKNYNVKFE